MEHYNWSNEKNEKLKTERGISFEQVILSITNDGLKAMYKHPNNAMYPNQSIMVVEIERYCYLVPYVEDAKGKFLKTVIPSRRATKMYMGDRNEES